MLAESMSIPFSELPGRHERHYRRRIDNPLFEPVAVLDDEQLLEMQRMDHEELVAFVDQLRATVGRAVELKPNEESEVILKLKEDLERLYETSAGLAEDQSNNQAAITQLMAVILRSIRANTGGDTLAEQEMAMEQQARDLHFELLKEPLVADLLHPESVVGEDQLVPTLLSSETLALEQALTLFDEVQRAELVQQAQALLDAKDPDQKMTQARVNLTLLRG